MDDESYASIFKPVIAKVRAQFCNSAQFCAMILTPFPFPPP